MAAYTVKSEWLVNWLVTKMLAALAVVHCAVTLTTLLTVVSTVASALFTNVWDGEASLTVKTVLMRTVPATPIDFVVRIVWRRQGGEHKVALVGREGGGQTDQR